MSDVPTDPKPPEPSTQELGLDALAGDATLGDRIALAAAEGPSAPPSSMEVLDPKAGAQRMRLQEHDPAGADADPNAKAPRSTLEPLARVRDEIRIGDGDEDNSRPTPSKAALEKLLAEWTRMLLQQGVPPSSIEPLLTMFGARLDLRPFEPSAPTDGGADLKTSDDRSSRVPLRDGAAAPTPLALLESLMRFTARMSLREKAPSADEKEDSGFTLSPHGRISLRGGEDEADAAGGGDPFAALTRDSRIQLRDRPDEEPPESSMGDLFEVLSAPERPDEEEDASGSSLDPLLNIVATPDRTEDSSQPSSMGDLFTLLAGADRPEEEDDTAASSMGDLFTLLAAADRPAAEAEQPASSMGDLFEILSAPARPDAEADLPASSMADLFRLLEAAEQAAHRPQREAPSSMRDILSAEAEGRVPLFKTRGSRTQSMPDDLSKLLTGPAAPRLELPERTRHRAPPAPDGVTPILPEREDVYGELDPRQGCPRKGVRPTEVGEKRHERLDFRYNRFRRVEIHRPLFSCPKCPDVESFLGAKPAFVCAEAPIGDGLLARMVVSRYFDRLPLDRLRTLLEQLGAPIPSSVLLNELDRASELIAPVVEVMRAGTDTEEAPLPALVTGTLRDSPGAVHVHTGGDHVVFSFASGEARKSDANRSRGPIAAQRWRGQGTRGRWSQIRQRFFFALLTDPDKARAGLYAIEKLPPEPPADSAALASLRVWLDAEYQAFDAPKNRFQHAVTAAKAMWALLVRPERSAGALASEAWVFERTDGDVHAALRWMSLTESCVGLGLQPWPYLHQLLRALAADPGLDPKQWTPRAFLRRG